MTDNSRCVSLHCSKVIVDKFDQVSCYITLNLGNFRFPQYYHKKKKSYLMPICLAFLVSLGVSIRMKLPFPLKTAQSEQLPHTAAGFWFNPLDTVLS